METESIPSMQRNCTGTALSPGRHVLPNVVDVLVVGLGPVGATIANLLGNYGISVLAIDKATEIFEAPRAIALDNEALRILQLAGISEGDFETLAIPFVRLHSPQLGEFARANTSGSIDGHPKLVTFYQPDLERQLRKRLNQFDNIHVGLGATLVSIVNGPKGVVAGIEDGGGRTHYAVAQYLIGADGASSVVRKLIGQDFQGQTYAEDWLVVDTSNVPAPIDHVEFFCDYRRPTPRMAAPGNRQRWEFMLKPGETPEQMESDACIGNLLSPWGSTDQMHIERKAVYRFHARIVDSFRNNRVFLAGDAAHITPPFVGQGLVAGLRDAANLSWKLSWVLRNRASAQILDSYNEERRTHAKSMIGMAKLMGKLVMPRNRGMAFLVHGFMRLIQWIPPLRAQFEELKFKPKNAFKRGLFVPGKSASKLRRGAPLPQGWVRGADQAVSLSDDILGTGFALIGFGCNVAAALSTDIAGAFAAAGGKIIQIKHRGQQLHFTDRHCWEDLEGVFMPRSARPGWVAMVRPDRTILHDGPIGEVDKLVLESLSLLGLPSPTQAAATSISPT